MATSLTNVDSKCLAARTRQGTSFVRRHIQNLRERPVLQPEDEHKGERYEKYGIPQEK